MFKESELHMYGREKRRQTPRMALPEETFFDDPYKSPPRRALPKTPPEEPKELILICKK